VHVARVGQRIIAYRDLVGKPEGKSTSRRTTYRWEDNIKMAPKETGWNGVVWLRLVQD